MPLWKNSLLPVSFKTCPRCHGTGVVASDPYDRYREESIAWAEKLNFQPVMVRRTFCDYSDTIAGLAIAKKLAGGWGALDIYVSVGEARPDPWVFNWRDINGKKFWYIERSWSQRDDVNLLDFWPVPLPELSSLLLEAGVEE